ncbi:hypothetical protein [Kozakia baliensis]|uniref:Uncharacterized protein n=1 Tax=Kozakia baliensis TaxID=153496 RepID=A0A1D8UYQ4_9PROT|nr:hypothetical protein [Kozakia baliensis]AOX18712.1 hypothetical protein A0U89_15515 [Kozakia baliensis]GBR35284.1 hypothetical protein AA0488_2942 [Kozakia baliensis NRIC 0488]GEL65780.1 hypothetical protein KBA01_30660 [Kozakia baliensis]
MTGSAMSILFYSVLAMGMLAILFRSLSGYFETPFERGLAVASAVALIGAIVLFVVSVIYPVCLAADFGVLGMLLIHFGCLFAHVIRASRADRRATDARTARLNATF